MLMGEVLIALLHVFWGGKRSAVGIKSRGGLREHHGVHGELERDFPYSVCCRREEVLCVSRRESKRPRPPALQGQEVWMEVCPDTHPMLTYCSGLLGSQETPTLQSPDFVQLMERTEVRKGWAWA